MIHGKESLVLTSKQPSKGKAYNTHLKEGQTYIWKLVEPQCLFRRTKESVTLENL